MSAARLAYFACAACGKRVHSFPYTALLRCRRPRCWLVVGYLCRWDYDIYLAWKDVSGDVTILKREQLSYLTPDSSLVRRVAMLEGGRGRWVGYDSKGVKRPTAWSSRAMAAL